MSELSQPSLAIYNPGLLAREDLARQFVVRRGLLGRLLDDLRAPAPNHHLLIGHRGMGKTTMLCRLRHCIEDDEALNARWMPLSFPEEQYNVSRLSDLWLNCLDALCDALEQRGEVEHAQRLDDLIDALPSNEERRSVATLDALKAWMAEHRGLVLLFDNLDLVLSRLDDDAHWRVRELMSQRDDLVIIGASSQPVDAMADYGAPFYEFFRVDELRGLNEAEARDVLIALAEAHDTPRVTQVVTTQPGRFRALHVLTGGNPRTLVLLYQVLAHDDSSDVHVDLERLLDQCTPLYKDRFESLPPQAQQLVDALALRWDPSSAHDLATHTRLDINKVSAQLNRLVKQGVIEKVRLPNTKRAGFQLAERFFNIWYLMRASRRVRRRLMWLVRFLELFYGEREMGGRAELKDPVERRRVLREAEQMYHQAAKDFPESASAHNRLAWHLYTQTTAPREALHHASLAVELAPADLSFAHTLSCIAAWNAEWALAAKYARQWLTDTEFATSLHWDETTAFFQESTLANRSHEALQLLIDAGLEDRWRPLAEALRAVTQPDHLLGVAPEVRAPARELLGRWEAERARRAASE